MRVKFTDFWEGFDNNHELYRIIKENFNIEDSDSPDYVICSCFGTDYLKYPNAVRIFYTGENICPDFNLFDYAIGFNFINFDDRYHRFPLYYLYTDSMSLAEKRNLTQADCAELVNRKFCSYIYSNGNPLTPRDEMFEKLSKYKCVDSGGKWKNNIGYRVPREHVEKIKWQSEYKFSICFENSVTNGYVTEKLLDGFAAKTIPIYLGSKSVNKDFNTSAFINCADFQCLDDVVDYVIHLDNNDAEYVKILGEPPFVTTNKTREEATKELIGFLEHVFNQNKETAFRRNTAFFSSVIFESGMRAYELNAKYPRYGVVTEIVNGLHNDGGGGKIDIKHYELYKTIAKFLMG